MISKIMKSTGTIIKKNRKVFFVEVISMIVFFVYIFFYLIIPKYRVHKAISLRDDGKYLEAVQELEELNKYRYKDEIEVCQDLYIESLKKEHRYDSAIEYLMSVEGAQESSQEVYKCKYSKGTYLINQKEYDKAIEIFKGIDGFLDSNKKLQKAKYLKAGELAENGSLKEAAATYGEIVDYEDSRDKKSEVEKELKYQNACSLLSEGKYADAVRNFNSLGDYKDSKQLLSDNKEKGLEELYNSGEYDECVKLGKVIYCYSDKYYAANYEAGMALYEKGDLIGAAPYLKECEEYYPDVSPIVAEAEREAKYQKGVNDAENGMIDDAIENLSAISGYKDSSTWLAKCREAARYTGKFISYSYVIYDEDGSVHDLGAGQGYGDSKYLWISASVDKNFEITYYANGKKAEKGTMMVYYHKYGDSDNSYIDIVNKKIVNQFLNGDGSNGSKYVALYKSEE